MKEENNNAYVTIRNGYSLLVKGVRNKYLSDSIWSESDNT